MSYNHDHESEVNYFAKTNFRNQMTKFGIKTDDRRRHVYVIGKTGMGKTVLLENFILSDIYAGHGCCYVDPHGDTAEKLIDYIPSWRLNDVVYFNPADMDFPVGFNILEAVSESHKHLVVSGMMGVFQKIWENMWSSRMEYILNNTLLALLDTPGQTLLGINRLLSDADFRKRIVGNVKDPVVKQFWLIEFASYNEKYAQEAVAPIQNKIGQFLSAVVIRNIVAQVKSSINVREIMDTEKIFIINLSKGRIGEDNSRLLGGLLITKMQLAAMERVDTPEHERKDFYLYVDEFQNFAVESFASILSEARKYRLCLTMAHQYIAQLTEEVRDAVFGNVGTIITFRVGSPDAMFMEAEFMPRFTPEDIINLPKYNIYIKLLIDGVTSQPFSAITLPPISQTTHSGEKVIKVSRERYARPRAEIEEKILTWSGMEDADVDELLQEAADKKKAAKESKKPRFEYKCSRCGKEVILPVELDRSRPIYCDDCIAIVRDERKGKSGLKAGSGSAGKGKPAFQVERPPKPTEGEVIEKFPDEPSISLGALAKPEKVPPKATEPEKILRVDTALDGPSLDLGALIQAQPKPRMEERKPRPEVRKSTPRSESYAYTCSDCGSSFTAGVKLDPSRPLYCENCLTKIRERRKADTASKPPSTVTNVGGEAPLEKRKRKRKKKPAQTIMSDRTQSFAAPVSVPYPSPVPQPEPKDQTGTLHTGQTIRFD
ncbi:MAG TPA: type IV secretion system DNA-binding domain-containing protein [Patescibacteria group bacterium]|nr:type IV secretion system DNA-binding domain-containing protein [Patescibacteria group bacterium]